MPHQLPHRTPSKPPLTPPLRPRTRPSVPGAPAIFPPRQIRTFALLLLLPGNPLPPDAPEPSPQTSTATIPVLHATSLSGQTVDLPSAFRGKTGVLVLGFDRAAQTQVTAWSKRLHDDFSRADDVVFYNLPVIGAVPSLLRGIILRSMRSAVPPIAQERCVPITTDEPQWRSVSGYIEPDEAYVLLVGGRGDILDRLHGNATDDLYLRLRREIDLHRKSLAAPAKAIPS